MVYIPVRLNLNRTVGKAFVPDIFRRRISQVLGFHGHKVHQVVDMEHIARGKDARHIGLEIFIHHSALCPAVQGNACIQGKFIFRYQSH